MNRYISIGFSIAVAPAILLAFGNWTQSLDTITVSEWALFNFGIPIGGVLVVAGLLATTNKQIETFLCPKEKISLSRVASECAIWASSIAITYEAITISFKTTAFDMSDQSLLDTIIGLQALIGAALIRVFLAFFERKLMVGLRKKIGMIILLLIILFGLTLYSDMLSHRWWQGYKDTPVNFYELMDR